MNYIEYGEMLEAKGLSDTEIDVILEHSGVKGMKWGVRRAEKLSSKSDSKYEKRSAKGDERFGNRNNKQLQRRVDRISRVASGTASRSDQAKSLLLDVPLQKIILEGGLKGGAAGQLDSAKRIQTKVVSGKKRTFDTLNRMGGVDIREIDYSYNE